MSLRLFLTILELIDVKLPYLNYRFNEGIFLIFFVSLHGPFCLFSSFLRRAKFPLYPVSLHSSYLFKTSLGKGTVKRPEKNYIQ